MAMITRSFNVTEVRVMVYDVDTNEVKEKIYDVFDKFTEVTTKLIKRVKALLSDNEKLIDCVISKSYVDTYAISDEQFLTLASFVKREEGVKTRNMKGGE